MASGGHLLLQLPWRVCASIREAASAVTRGARVRADTALVLSEARAMCFNRWHVGLTKAHVDARVTAARYCKVLEGSFSVTRRHIHGGRDLEEFAAHCRGALSNDAPVKHVIERLRAWYPTRRVYLAIEHVICGTTSWFQMAVAVEERHSQSPSARVQPQ